MILSGGACPVCDRDVPRTLALGVGLPKEIFHCPTHGRMEYTPHHVPLHQLGIAAAGMALFAQPTTGLELVH